MLIFKKSPLYKYCEGAKINDSAPQWEYRSVRLYDNQGAGGQSGRGK